MAKKKWKLAPGKTWRMKLEQNHPSHGKIVEIPASMQKKVGKGDMLIPRPIDVDQLMKRAKKGKLITVSQIRTQLAKQANVEQCCPLTTGIFIKIAAETAVEDLDAGRKRVTPYWRTVREDGSLNDKFPGGADAQAKRLIEEGHAVERVGRSGKWKVLELDRRLVRFDN